jgi:hypothetical protein
MLIGHHHCSHQQSLRFRAGWSFAVIMVIVLAGCSTGDGEDAITPDATSSPELEQAPPPIAQLGSVTWATGIDESGAPVDDLEEFSRHSSLIYAVVEVENASAGETLSAAWSLDDVPIEAIASTATIDREVGSGWVSFSLTWEGESLWPVGTLGVAITASSGATTTGAIPITSS